MQPIFRTQNMIILHDLIPQNSPSRHLESNATSQQSNLPFSIRSATKIPKTLLKTVNWRFGQCLINKSVYYETTTNEITRITHLFNLSCQPRFLLHMAYLQFKQGTKVTAGKISIFVRLQNTKNNAVAPKSMTVHFVCYIIKPISP